MFNLIFKDPTSTPPERGRFGSRRPPRWTLPRTRCAYSARLIASLRMSRDFLILPDFHLSVKLSFRLPHLLPSPASGNLESAEALLQDSEIHKRPNTTRLGRLGNSKSEDSENEGLAENVPPSRIAKRKISKSDQHSRPSPRAREGSRPRSYNGLFSAGFPTGAPG